MLRNWMVQSLVASIALLGQGCNVFRTVDTTAAPANFDYDPGYPIQGIRIENFENYAVAQEDPVWCWAACALMVRDYFETQGALREKADQAAAAAKQKVLADRIKVNPERKPMSEQPATPVEVLGAINAELYEVLLVSDQVTQDNVIPSVVEALFDELKAEELENRPDFPEPVAPSLGFDAERLYWDLKGRENSLPSPVVAALRNPNGTGHVVVVIGAQYQEIPRMPTAEGEPMTVEHRLMAIQFWDPFKDSEDSLVKFGGEHWLAATEFAEHCDFIASPWSASEYLAYQLAHNAWAVATYGAPEPVLEEASSQVP